MEHHHSHGHHHEEGLSNITLAFLLNFGFAMLEILGGILTGSTAILSDAVHDFGDSLALAVSFIVEKLGHKPANTHYTYGYKRMALIGAFVNIIVLSVGTVFVVREALSVLVAPQPVKAGGMLLLAVVGILINGISVLRMKGSKKILDKTVMMHLMEDLLGWIAVLVVSIVIYFTNWYILDPILSLGICIVIGRNIWMNLTVAIQIVMQAVPDQPLFDAIQSEIEGVEGVKAVKALHMWTLDGEEHIVTASLAVKEGVLREGMMNQIKGMLESKGIAHSTIEID
ncbi:MAG: cation diffusion facilitator family transporter [Cellulosilyticaceae bacterium]